ncbi:hypothetical protein CTAYLR_000495 [Chrysophaeum taylorii]|uniref:EF-hand domain-containing protein n=1 Tax=Chrysophaeum taylorii TaxID=2483200 RepID=A0AAD7XN69_9STRA|nr:hypothetical protein CTAYLR_000495 [Chrysophaeum taylorii]
MRFCWCAREADGPKDEEKGPLAGANKRCTDVVCLVALVACWVCLSFVGFVVLGWIESDELPRGDPRRLIHGLDYLGSICGVDDRTDRIDGTSEYRRFDVSKLPKAYFLPSGGVVCLDECPGSTDVDAFVCEYDVQEELDAFIADRDADAYHARGIEGVTRYECNFRWKTTDFVNHCIFDDTPDFAEALRKSKPSTNNNKDWPSAPPTVRRLDHGASATTTPTSLATTTSPTFNATLRCEQSLDRAYCDALVKSSARSYYCFGLFCPECPLPGACDFACDFCETPAPTLTISQQRGSSSTLGPFEKIAADLLASYALMLAFGFGISTVASFAYLALLRVRWFLRALVWGLLTSIFVTLVATGAVTADTARNWRDEDPRLRGRDEIVALEALSTALCASAALYACTILALRKRIALAVAVIREAARALSHMPSLLLVPVFQCVGNLCFFAVWIVYATYLASSARVETVETQYGGDVSVTYKELAYSREQQYAALYLVFAWFWTTEFVEAIGDLVVACAVVRWYFDRAKPRLASPVTLGALALRVCKRHAGTAAFGGLVLALAKTVRVLVAALKRRAAPSERSRIARLAISCVDCCLGCVERCVRFVNKHAYVETAIRGVGFCAAGRRAFSLLTNHGLRVASCAVVATFVLNLGTLAVTTATAFSFYAYATVHFDDGELHSFIPPTVVVFLMALAAVKVFNGIFDAVITAVLHCFVVDEADYADHPYASGSLRDVIARTHERARGRLGFSKPKSWTFEKRQKTHVGDLQARFDEFDADHSGHISLAELEALLETCTGSRPNHAELKEMMRSLDKDKDGAISYPEFVAIHDKAVAGDLEFKALADALRAFDDLLDTVPDDDDDDDD